MKILQVVHSFIPHISAGTEIYTYQLSKELLKNNELHVFYRVNNPSLVEYTVSHLEYEGLYLHAINNTFNKCNSFRRLYDEPNIDVCFANLLDEIKPDVVHIHHLLFLSMGIVKEAKKRRIPIIFTLHDYWLFCHRCNLLKEDLNICQGFSINGCRQCLDLQLNIKGNALSCYNFLRKKINPSLAKLAKDAYRMIAQVIKEGEDILIGEIKRRDRFGQEVISLVDEFIAPSNFLLEKFLSFGVPCEKIRFLRHGILKHRNISVVERPRNGVLRFGFIGTLLPMKGIDILIKAFKKIPDPKIELLIYGKAATYAGYENYLGKIKQLIAKDKRIKLMGAFNNSDIYKVMSYFDILVVPSIWPENSPLVIQEALNFNKNVIASGIGGILELAEGSKSMSLFKPGDELELRQKMSMLIPKSGDFPFSREGRSIVKTIKENANEIMSLYLTLLSN